MKKKSTAGLLALLLIFAVISTAACAEKKTSGDGKQDSQKIDESQSSDDDDRLKDNLPEVNFNDKTFTIYTVDTVSENYFAETYTNEPVNDAIYNRNSTIEQRFGMKFALMTESTAEILNSKIRNSIQANTHDFDLAFEHVIYGPNNALAGCYMNLYDLDSYLDFSKPWWPDRTVEELTLNGKMLIGYSSASNDSIRGCKVVVANRALVESAGNTIPYDLVYDGKWTMDQLIAAARGYYDDLNGDGIRDPEDQYGYATQPVQNGFLTSCEVPILKKTDTGLEIAVNNNRTVELINKLVSWYYDSGDVLVTWYDTDPILWTDNFAAGHSAYAFAKLSMVSTIFRYSEVEYGILPQPKWDEEQEHYRTFSSGNGFGVPITTPDLEFAGVILEAMSAEGYKQVIPVYFETVLKDKLSRDDETRDMLDLIHDSRAVSFAYIYDNWEGFGHMTGNFCGRTSGNTDFSSYYASRVDSAQARLEKINDVFFED